MTGPSSAAAAIAGISEQDVVTHRKRVCQILRYIASMQSNASENYEFVRESKSWRTPPFFQNGAGSSAGSDDDTAFGTEHKIIFTTFDFQRLNALEQKTVDHFQPRPFAFYSALPSSGSGRKSASRAPPKKRGTAPCWLRLTRPSTTESSSKKNEQSQVNTSEQEMKRILEPMYNRLFEWLQDHNEDLVWGLGLAQMHDGEQTISGPLLEVRVEVELAKDGALLVRPKEHTGVSLNREVLSALATSGDNTARILSQTVNELDTCQISPGQPQTFIPLLKRMAVELSSEGKFISASKIPIDSLPQAQGLVVSDAFCLYSNPKPSAVWARDALKFAEELSNPETMAPKALWSMTHGAGMLDRFEEAAARELASQQSFLGKLKGLFRNDPISAPRSTRPLFPLPTSTSQNRIAELLLEKNYPAVVCEGPPGTGKTHTIANIICAYLTQGKRVLVTSKGAPALSVLRDRLPPCVQDLCVDVSMSESAGMRQLQQTVERLANKVSWASTEGESKKVQALMDKIEDLENELNDLDKRMGNYAEQKRRLVETSKGQEFFSEALSLIEEVPWLMKTASSWDLDRLSKFQQEIFSLKSKQDELTQKVTGFKTPPSDCLISLVASYAGGTLSSVKQSMQRIFARFPVLGPGLEKHRDDVRRLAAEINLNASKPGCKNDWKLVLEVLQHEKILELFFNETLKRICEQDEWPIDWFFESDNRTGRKRIKDGVDEVFERVVRLCTTSLEIGAPGEIESAIISRSLDIRRSIVCKQLQELAESLVDAKVVAELSKSFSAEAQSSLIQFSQIAGKAKFGSSAQPSKMTARQRRRRQEYLNSFAKCVQFIPCWILTSSQISDYLPATCCFDLVVLDESSQSDISILPGMLRAKQWLVVGDSKQVSPTESFVREDDIVKLQDALPQSPLEDSFLPGRSFFDLCAQAFPRGRVVLREHFRCAPELIAYSNGEFYNGNLTPLRLPTSAERLQPSLIDVRVKGTKSGKINERECDEIVRRIALFVSSCPPTNQRSIGVISLVGDDQSRLIRGRLLEEIGPKAFKDHDILIGSPSTFQGAERDIVFLSMVCSPKKVPTQIQLMYAQRANVALSRARDRMVLVRSIGADHIANDEDIKHSIINFFEKSVAGLGDDQMNSTDTGSSSMSSPSRAAIVKLLAGMLISDGYIVRPMGIVWDGALCIESSDGDARAAITIEGSGESKEEWNQHTGQQRSIERVGWKCLRVDAIYFLSDYYMVLDICRTFLSSVNVRPSATAIDGVRRQAEAIVVAADEGSDTAIDGRAPAMDQRANGNRHNAIEVSTDEEFHERKSLGRGRPASSHSLDENASVADALGNGEKDEDYGLVVDPRSFLGASSTNLRPKKRQQPPKVFPSRDRKNSGFFDLDSEDSDSHMSDELEAPLYKQSKRKRRLNSSLSRRQEFSDSDNGDSDIPRVAMALNQPKRKHPDSKNLLLPSDEETGDSGNVRSKRRSPKKRRSLLTDRQPPSKRVSGRAKMIATDSSLSEESFSEEPLRLDTTKPVLVKNELESVWGGSKGNRSMGIDSKSVENNDSSVVRDSPKRRRTKAPIMVDTRAAKKPRSNRKSNDDSSSSDESIHSSDDEFIALSEDEGNTDTEDELAGGVQVKRDKIERIKPAKRKRRTLIMNDANNDDDLEARSKPRDGSDVSLSSDVVDNSTVNRNSPTKVRMEGTKRRSRINIRDGKWRPVRPEEQDLPHVEYLKEVEDEPLSPSPARRSKVQGPVPPLPLLLKQSEPGPAEVYADEVRKAKSNDSSGEKEAPVDLSND